MPENRAKLSRSARRPAFQLIGDPLMKKWKVAGINFDHMHMGDNLRMAFEHPHVEIVGLCDETPERMNSAIQNFKIAKDRVFMDYRQCLERTKPDIVLLCPATATHGEWT